MKLFIHSPIFRIVAPFFSGGLAYLCTLMAFGRIIEIKESFELGEWLLCIGLAYVLLEGLRLLYFVARKYVDFGENAYSQVGLQLILNVFFSLSIIGIGVSAYFIFILGFRSLSSFNIEMWTINIIYVFITIAYTSATSSISILQIKNDQAWEEAKNRQESLSFNLIRYNQEIQPELLYNGLETTIPYLYKNPEMADELIQKLSQVYRYQLEKRKEELVKLSEELKIIQSWLYIWQQKYPGQIKWRVQFDQHHLQFLILPGSLMRGISHLMEYSLFSHLQPLQIHLSIKNEMLQLSVNRNDRLSPATSSHKHLQILQQSYRPFTEVKVAEELTAKERKIVIPMLVN